MSQGAIPLEQLLGWLDTDPGRLERHLERYPDDADLLDAHTALDPAALALLDRALAPPAALLGEVSRRLLPDRATSEALGVVADLLGLGWHTAAAIFGTGPVLRHDHPHLSDHPSGSEAVDRDDEPRGGPQR